MFGQVGFFNKFAGKAYEDKRPRDRYATESARLLGVLDERSNGPAFPVPLRCAFTSNYGDTLPVSDKSNPTSTLVPSSWRARPCRR
jgi:hypothetical protein